MRTYAWKSTLLLTGALAACNSPVTTADSGPDTGFIMTHDGGGDSGPPVDANRPPDANLPPYDGGPAVSCTGLTPLTLSTYCSALADTYVAQFTRCGVLGTAGATELRASVIADCSVTNLMSRVAAGTVMFDGAMAACCFAHSGGDSACFVPVGGGDTTCGSYIHGTIANGQHCVDSLECSDGYCHVEDSCPGTCTPFAAPGTTCNVGDVICDAMSTCDNGQGGSNKCVRQTGMNGDTCNNAMGMGCAIGFYCDSGTCRAQPTRGQTCNTNDVLCDLNSSICDYDYASMSGICSLPMPIGTMRCLIDAQCAGDAYCANPNFAAQTYGTCTARATRGQSCAMAPCVNGLACLHDGTCGDLPTMGMPCVPASGCRNAICGGGGTCIARHAVGDTCRANTDCASGNCRAMTLTCGPDCNP